MTVKELIHELSKHGKNRDVVIWDSFSDKYIKIIGVHKNKLFKSRKGNYIDDPQYKKYAGIVVQLEVR